MLNAIGLQNPGMEVFRNRDIPFMKKYDTVAVVNVVGKSTDEYIQAVEALGDTDVDMLEINISCPNVKEGGIAFGTDKNVAAALTKEIKAHAKQPVIMKLSPNVTSITEMAKAVEDAGADAISLINTVTGMKIDVERQSIFLANKTGGLSGPAIRPIAVRMVYEASHSVKIPVIGMGGITCAEDALEFILAGATAVSVGTASFNNPYTAIEVIDGIRDYMVRKNINSIKDIIGIV